MRSARTYTTRVKPRGAPRCDWPSTGVFGFARGVRAGRLPCNTTESGDFAQMDSSLRPRDIQARIRAGASPEDVAAAAGIPVERLAAFAAPVVAEREHVAGLARTNPVRRRGETTSHRALRNAVADSLAALGVDADDVAWDAWKLEDRRWRVRATWGGDDTEHVADFAYDQAGRFSVADNEEARLLVGDSTRTPPVAPAQDDLALVRALSVADEVADEPTPAPEAQPEEAAPAASEGDSDDLTDAYRESELAEVDGVYEIAETDSGMDVLYDMLSSFDEDSVKIYAGLVHPKEEAAPPAEPPAEPEPAVEEPEQLSLIEDVDAPAPLPKPKPRKKRAQVPSWDEIVFGGPRSED